MISIQPDDTALFLPKPFYLVVEDVGWWQGHDGSALNEPYRNNVPRRHCIKDYEALRHLAQRLSMRIALAMVLGEWDRNNFLRNVPGATWMGCSWDNSANQGPWLDQAAQFLIEHDKYLEIAMHGLCHEYWTDGRMQRSEFHDDKNHMREQAILRIHLDAYGKLLRQNGLPYSPRLFIPPALHHSFGNGDESMQALLYSYGVDHVTTRFDRARQIRPPKHHALTWECNVGILERGVSPVNWATMAAQPTWNEPGPIMALHWANLLHPDPERNTEIADAWADMILEKTSGPEFIIAEDLSTCWRQSAAYYLADITNNGNQAIIDIHKIPDIPCFSGSFTVRLQCGISGNVTCSGAEILSQTTDSKAVSTIKLLPHKKINTISLRFT